MSSGDTMGFCSSCDALQKRLTDLEAENRGLATANDIADVQIESLRAEIAALKEELANAKSHVCALRPQGTTGLYVDQMGDAYERRKRT